MSESQSEGVTPNATLSSPSDDIFSKIKAEREKNEALLKEMQKFTAANERYAAMSVMGGSAVAGSKVEQPKTAEQQLEEKAEQMALEATKRLLGPRF